MNVINKSDDGQFLKSKKWLALISGFIILFISIRFSAGGFGNGVAQSDKWIGYALAIAVCATEFMVASDYRKLNVSMIVLGGAAYTYSIYTNVLGFYIFRGMGYSGMTGDYMNLAGGVFLDVFPEVAIAWALNESKVGDFFGNLIKAYNKPQEMINNQNQNQTQPNKPHERPKREEERREVKVDDGRWREAKPETKAWVGEDNPNLRPRFEHKDNQHRSPMSKLPRRDN